MARAVRRPSSPSPEYERRLIVFIDFLGFKEVVAATEQDPAGLRRLLAAMDAIAEIGDSPAVESQQLTQFSDSIVVSYRVTETSGVFWLLNAMALTVVDLASRGFLLRGAVTTGDLYHTDAHVVGPAMVRAYEMESREAKYPRVIIDPALVAIARRRRGNDHRPDEEERYVRTFMREDEDGRLYFDYVSWDTVVEGVGADDDDYGRYLARIGEMVERGLQHEHSGVLEKYLWLHRHYLEALDRFTALPPEHGYRRQSPENCALIDGLPRYESRARAARERVEAAARLGSPRGSVEA